MDPRVLAFAGTWQITAGLAELQAGCGSTGLDSGILNLELIGGVSEDGAHTGGYRVTSPALDTASPIQEGDATLEAAAFSSGPGAPDVLFLLAGVYYYPANDVTVEIGWNSPGVSQGGQDTFQVDLDYAIFEGYQITAEPLGENDFDDDDDGQVDEEDEQGFGYLADPKAFLLCEGALRLEGTRSGQESIVTYSGVAVSPTGPLESMPIVARYHPDLEGIVFVFESNRERGGSHFAEVRGDSFHSLERSGAGWTLVSGRGSRQGLAGTIVELEADGGWGLKREFRALKVEDHSTSWGSFASGVEPEGGMISALRNTGVAGAAAAVLATRR
ncbi:MAG: hypothetical protein HOP15_04915 [Planctomycetes bacterium]|nr:hypothetical protein [Planctomycetota bacterium]